VAELDQALKDFRAAKYSAAEGNYAVACIAAQQAAGKALIALLESMGRRAQGETLGDLLRGMGDKYDVSQLARAAAELDSYYRGYREGLEGFEPDEVSAARAVARAEQIIVWAREQLSRSARTPPR
jgi:HEPN domain-containing protein